MSQGTVFIDGEYVDPADARMSIFDAGFVWGDSVYDVCSTHKGWFFMLDEHIERFSRSCDGFRLDNPYSHDEMRRICAECVQRSDLQDSYVKLQITRGVSAPGNRDPRQSECKVVIYAIPYVWIWGEDKCRNGVNLRISNIERVSSKAIDQRFKNYNRADLVQARFEAYDHGCDDAVLCGPDGNLTEGPGYNLFIVNNGKVSSPDYNVLEGVTRRAVRELCEQAGIPFELRKIHPDEMREAAEVFTSTTAGGVMPVIQVDSLPIGNGHAGLTTTQLQSLYWQHREQGWHGTRVTDILSATV